MKTPIIDLSEHLPLSTRRVVRLFGQNCIYGTPIGLVEALADGKILLRDLAKNTYYEITPEEARAIAKAFTWAALGAEEGAKRARGYYKMRARRDASGVLFVTHNDATLPMRISKLRRPRACDWCDARVMTIYVVADKSARRGLWSRGKPTHDANLCEPCADALASEPESIAEVAPLPAPTPKAPS